MRNTILKLFCLCIVFITVQTINGQPVFKKLTEKAKKTVTGNSNSRTAPNSENKPSTTSVLEVPKVDMSKLAEASQGSLKNLNLFYGAGYEIMKNKTGLVLSSSDGINWMVEYKSPTTEIFGVAYGEGKIVAVGGGNVYYTTDGKSWNTVSEIKNSVINGDYQAVAYGGGMFVAVGKTATLTFSKDGETWVRYFGEELDPEYRPGDTHFYGVSYVNGKFYVIGNSNRIISLIPDPKEGLKKEKCTVLGRVTDRLNDLAYGNGNYIAVGTKDDYISNDGQNWTVTNPEWQIWGIGFDNGQFVKACGFGRVFTSTDGADNNWQETYQMSRTMYWDAVYGNNQWLVTGKDGVVLTSGDGITWESHTIKPCYTVKSTIFIK